MCAAPTRFLFSHLRFPVEHHKRIHSTFIERTFGETRRRVKVIGRLPGERSCLGLVWAMLDRASRGFRGVTMTPPPFDTSKSSAASCFTHRLRLSRHLGEAVTAAA